MGGAQTDWSPFKLLIKAYIAITPHLKDARARAQWV
jgi:hypothetical protein